ncbi:hypothetical protein KGM48_02855 [Patescibacteria group bacterium]|nr:hypothetical protein [Patescibacteria group bacterium]
MKKVLLVSVLSLAIATPAFAAGPYTTGQQGYDVGFNTSSLPVAPFGFGVVGTDGGRAYTHNPNFAIQFAWAKQGTDASAVYMNLNTDVGSYVHGNVSSPKICKGGDSLCKAYNYGYNAAASSFAYATQQGAASTLWWLDIETANSWSSKTTVNDATVQGAIDYLNTQGITVGVYAIPSQWQQLMGSSFVPVQTGGTPNWYADGYNSNYASECNAPFIPGSSVWLVQYLQNSTTDNDYGC